MSNRLRGRPVGSVKAKKRERVKNPNGRIIDKDGVQYKRLINNGYMLNDAGSQLIKNESFKSQKVKNPDTGRMTNLYTYKRIPKINSYKRIMSHKFKQLSDKYFYDEKKNEFVSKVFDPKQNKVYNDFVSSGYT